MKALLLADALQLQIDLATLTVSHYLAPLHVGNRELWIWNVLFAENDERNEPGVGQVLTGY